MVAILSTGLEGSDIIYLNSRGGRVKEGHWLSMKKKEKAGRSVGAEEKKNKRGRGKDISMRESVCECVCVCAIEGTLPGQEKPRDVDTRLHLLVI